MEGTVIKYTNGNNLKYIVEEFCNAVVGTMGPGGKNVIIDQGDIVPLVTKDGVTVSESISYTDPYKNAIVSLIKEAARKTGNEVGDGTTTSTLLAKMLIIQGLDKLTGSINRYEFFEALDEASMIVTDYLNDSITEVENDHGILESIVKISTNSDEAITKLIMEAVDKAGADGIINVKKYDEPTTAVSVTDGASINSTVFIDQPTEYETADIVLVEGPITDVNDIVPILKHASLVGNVVLVAKEFDERVLKVLQINRKQYKANVIAVEAEGFGNGRVEVLERLSHVTGATVLSSDKSTSTDVRDFSAVHAAAVSEVNINPSEVVFTPTRNIDPKEREQIVNDLKTRYNAAKVDMNNTAKATQLKRMLSKYSNVATIYVGGTTEGEVVEREARVTDAVCAVSAAINGGVLPGGGRALECAIKALKEAKKKCTSKSSRNTALDVMIEACRAPIATLCANVGIYWSDYEGKEEFKDENMTLDLINLKVVNAFKSGILDPALVSINAVRNSISVAKTILRTNVAVLPDIDG